MREIATSGAYLASLGAKKIFANQGTITGSIGVNSSNCSINFFYGKN